jgi:DNA-binding transcriptional MerR regulator
MSTHDIRRKPQPPIGAASDIPDKLYFRIGDVAQLCDVPAYVLRFWESQFPQLKPNKSGTGQRLYRRRDVEIVLYIKELLYSHVLTIAGAKQVLKHGLKAKREQSALPFQTEATVAPAKLRGLRQELADILGILDHNPITPPKRAADRKAEKKKTVEFPEKNKLF